MNIRGQPRIYHTPRFQAGKIALCEFVCLPMADIARNRNYGVVGTVIVLRNIFLRRSGKFLRQILWSPI